MFVQSLCSFADFLQGGELRSPDGTNLHMRCKILRSLCSLRMTLDGKNALNHDKQRPGECRGAVD